MYAVHLSDLREVQRYVGLRYSPKTQSLLPETIPKESAYNPVPTRVMHNPTSPSISQTPPRTAMLSRLPTENPTYNNYLQCYILLTPISIISLITIITKIETHRHTCTQSHPTITAYHIAKHEKGTQNGRQISDKKRFRSPENK